jgi:hypothetical protein
VPFKKYIDSGERKERDNIWYFKPGSTGSMQVVGNGTAENPFVGFTPSNSGAINPNIGVIDRYPLMYFAPGNYSFGGFSSRGIADRYNLPEGWGMYGRTTDYKVSAMGDDRAKFYYGGVDLTYNSGEGNLPTTLNSIRITNNKAGKDNAALYANNASDVILQNVDIENNFSTSIVGTVSVFGIYANQSVLNFVRLNDFVDGESTVVGSGITSSGSIPSIGKGYGLFVDNNSTVNFISGSNTVTGSGTTATGADYGEGYGIFVDHASIINFVGGANTIRGIGNDLSTDKDIGYGVYAKNNSTINLQDGINTIEGLGNGHGSVHGLADGVYMDFSTLNFVGGTNTVEGSANNVSRGIENDKSTINFTGGTNIVKAIGSGANDGILVDSSTVNFSGGTNTIVGVSGQSGRGIDAYDSVINFTSGTNVIEGFGSSSGFGIKAADSIVNFANSSENKVTIAASGTTNQVGIYADGGSSHLQRNGVDLQNSTTIADMQQYINFKYYQAGIGKAVQWASHFFRDWPTS